LEGHGIPGAEVNRTSYVGAIPGSSYSSGPAPGVVLNVQNMMEEVYTPIWNAIGVINGTNADETIIIGNHRDAWIIGGAGKRMLPRLTRLSLLTNTLQLTPTPALL
jgi:N-acetylated-alpha-linked acidic dipeptidase